MKVKYLISWICQLVTAVIMAGAGWGKITGAQASINLFQHLGMEPTGRFIIGVIELSITILLLVPKLSPLGALLAVATMVGAAIAHLTKLGFNYSGDGGLHVMMLAVVLTSSIVILVTRRKHVPLLGPYLAEDPEKEETVDYEGSAAKPKEKES